MSSLTEVLFYNRGERYFEFTNFAEYPILLDDEEWPTTEHYFQAQKFIGTPYFKYIRTLQTPRDAFSLSRQPQVSQWLRDDWEQVKLDIMYKALLAKFFQHSNLRDMLLRTGKKKLIEHTSNDSYWGDGGNGTGQNHLGRLLMKVRSELWKLEPDANHLDTHLFDKNGMLNIHSTYETTGPSNSNASNGFHRSLGTSNECLDIDKTSGTSGAYTANESNDNDVLPGSCGAADANASIDSPNTNEQSSHTASDGCLDAKGSSTPDASYQSLDTRRLNNAHASNELSDVVGPLLDGNGTFDGKKQPLLDSNGQTPTETLNVLPATTGSRDNINSTDATVSSHSFDSVELSNVNTNSPDSNIANQPVDTTEQPPYTSTSNESPGVRTSNGLHNTNQLLDARSGSSNANTRNRSSDTNDQPLPNASAPAGTETISGLLAINGLTGMDTLIPSPMCEINQSPDITSAVCCPKCSPFNLLKTPCRMLEQSEQVVDLSGHDASLIVSIQRDQLTKGTAKQLGPEVQFDALKCFQVEHITNDTSRHCANSEGIEEHQFMTEKNDGMIVQEFNDHRKQGVPATKEGYDKEPISKDLCVHVQATSGVSVLHNVICNLEVQPYQSNPEKRVLKVRSQIKLQISITPDSLKSIMDNSKDIEVELDISKEFQINDPLGETL